MHFRSHVKVGPLHTNYVFHLGANYNSESVAACSITQMSNEPPKITGNAVYFNVTMAMGDAHSSLTRLIVVQH